MAQLRRDYAKFVERDAEVIAVGPEEYNDFREWWVEHEMPFVGLADPDHAVADLYGQETHLIKGGRMPARFVIDKLGLVRHQHYGGSMGDIPPNTEVLQLLDRLNDQQNE
jgi:peroxiredoxin Q/BCP